MKKFFQLVPLRHILFVLFLFAAVLLTSFVQNYFRINVEFSDTDISITSSKYSMRVDFDLVESIELMEMPDRGELVDGRNSSTLRYGNWKNDTWGDYVVLITPHATNCIVIHLTDGRTFVFNIRSNEDTASTYATFQTYLDASVLSAA